MVLVPDDWMLVIHEAQEDGWMVLFIPPFNLRGVNPDVLRSKLIGQAWNIIDEMASKEHDC